jgi:hypothetical protein
MSPYQREAVGFGSFPGLFEVEKTSAYVKIFPVPELLQTPLILQGIAFFG